MNDVEVVLSLPGIRLSISRRSLATGTSLGVTNRSGQTHPQETHAFDKRTHLAARASLALNCLIDRYAPSSFFATEIKQQQTTPKTRRRPY